MKFRFDRLAAACAIGAGVVCIDRLTKQWALRSALQGDIRWGPVSFELAFNRGISWGMLHSYNPIVQTVIVAGIAIILILFGAYTYDAFVRNRSIVPHGLIIAGALSNLWDRVWYPGVIDFIVVSAYGWYFPSFNCADAAIVVGVLMLFVSESEIFQHE